MTDVAKVTLMTITMTCISITNQLQNGKPTYIATLTYVAQGGVSQMTVSSDTAFKFVVGQTYTATIV